MFGKILNLIRGKPEITINEIVQATGLTRRDVEWNLDKLKAENIIERKGSKKSGYWEIKQ